MGHARRGRGPPLEVRKALRPPDPTRSAAPRLFATGSRRRRSDAIPELMSLSSQLLGHGTT